MDRRDRGASRARSYGREVAAVTELHKDPLCNEAEMRHHAGTGAGRTTSRTGAFLRARMQSAFSHAAAIPVAGRAARRLFHGRLRVLAYHDVTDPRAFEAQVRHLVEHYTPVSGQAVATALHEQAPLPPDAVWVTFDDGHPSVVDEGQPILDHFGVPATLFVCPGMIDTDRPFWWTVVQVAMDQGLHVDLDGRRWADARLVSRLKRLPDSDRRVLVSRLSRELRDRDALPRGEQLQRSALGRWIAAGHEVGNHTWDHPCLDRCSPDEQVDQVRRADQWLRAHVPDCSPFFAYPNGNWSPDVEEELRAAGYALAVGFDHRLDQMRHPLRVSRLRIDADAPPERFAAIVSGLHAAAFQLLSRSRSATQPAQSARTTR